MISLSALNEVEIRFVFTNYDNIFSPSSWCAAEAFQFSKLYADVKRSIILKRFLQSWLKSCRIIIILVRRDENFIRVQIFQPPAPPFVKTLILNFFRARTKGSSFWICKNCNFLRFFLIGMHNDQIIHIIQAMALDAEIVRSLYESCDW